jgi:isoquinoline 1-oxidoreductase beta subunit
MNAVARMNEDGVVEVWAGHQMPDFYAAAAAEVAGVAPEKVRLHVMKTGGGFGRRGVSDADVIVEAVAAARAIGWRAPVKIQWTRENDMKGGRYRPAYVHALRAGLDDEGRILAWEHHIVGQSIMANGPMAAWIRDGVDPTSVEGAALLPYAIPNRTVGLTTTEVGVPVLWWRAVGSTHTAYAVETFLDQLAAAAGADPLDYRMALLGNAPRHAAVLRLAAEKGGWGTPAPEGRVRGLALAESFSTIVAQVVEIGMEDGAPVAHRVTCAVDCGIAINPDTVRAQMEGGVGFGLGAILARRSRWKGARSRRRTTTPTRRCGSTPCRGRGPHRPLVRASHRRRRARRAPDRPGGRQRRPRRHRQARHDPAHGKAMSS